MREWAVRSALTHLSIHRLIGAFAHSHTHPLTGHLSPSGLCPQRPNLNQQTRKIVEPLLVRDEVVGYVVEEHALDLRAAPGARQSHEITGMDHGDREGLRDAVAVDQQRLEDKCLI